eukprot:6677989-Prorocentrum_lima.AAC.1
MQYTAWASPIANLTTVRLVPVAVLGKLVIGMRKCEVPQSHNIRITHQCPLDCISPRFPTDTA